MKNNDKKGQIIQDHGTVLGKSHLEKNIWRHSEMLGKYNKVQISKKHVWEAVTHCGEKRGRKFLFLFSI